jgi:hypothetical protein
MRRNIATKLSFAWILFLVGTPALAKIASLKGQLYQGREAVSGAEVYLLTLDKHDPYRGPVTTDEAGLFAFEAVDKGSYCLVANKGRTIIGSTVITASDFSSGNTKVDLNRGTSCSKTIVPPTVTSTVPSAAPSAAVSLASPTSTTTTPSPPPRLPTLQDRVLIVLFCSICGIVVLYPIVRYLTKHWAFRRDRLFGFLERGAIVYYYKQFRPGEDPLKAVKAGAGTLTPADYMAAFKRDFNRWYGRKYYTAPLVMLSILTGVSAWWASKTLQSWTVDPSSSDSLRALVASALGGAFVWIISDELDRLRRRDFTVSDVYYYVFRLLLSIPFGWALTRATVTLQVGIPLAFFLGAFPTTTLFTIARRLGSQQLKLGDDAASGALELERLQSVGKSNAERFKDEGVTTICGLAYADPIDLTIRTNFDFTYVVDCVSQALMWIYFGDNCTTLFPLSLRGAQEVSTVVTWLLDPAHQAYALQTLADAATRLNISQNALRTTLDQIKDDPYTQFLVNVWC